MIRALLSFLWDGIPARFVSDYDLAESVRRLTLATARPGATAGVEDVPNPVAQGQVSARRVRLVRSAAGQRSGVPSQFSGAFRHADGRVVLEGRFELHAFVRALISLIGGFTVLALFMVGSALQQDADRLWWTPGIVLALAALGLALVAAGRAQATPDAAWLSALIQRALRAPPDAEAAATHHRNQAP